MNKDFISGPENDTAGESPEDGLAKALEVFVAHAPFRNPAGDASGGFTAPGAGSCPSIGEWFQLAAGELSPADREALLAHAALCTGCLARLRESQAAIHADASPDEAEDLKRFASTSPQWQRRLALELVASPNKPRRTGRLFVFAWLSGGLAAALVLALLSGVWWRSQRSPETLLAEASTQSRTFDLRMPDAGFSPVSPRQHLRGAGSGHEPAALLAARATIDRRLQQSPDDAHWMQMRARADVLEEHYDEAIATLDRLVVAGPATASLLLDDGIAHYLRGTASGSDTDRATALDDLRRADELAPNDPVVLFNEAITMEDRGQRMNAIETWNRFLKFERDPQWLNEGRRRLSALEEKLNRIKTQQSRVEFPGAVELTRTFLVA